MEFRPVHASLNDSFHEVRSTKRNRRSITFFTQRMLTSVVRFTPIGVTCSMWVSCSQFCREINLLSTRALARTATKHSWLAIYRWKFRVSSSRSTHASIILWRRVARTCLLWSAREQHNVSSKSHACSRSKLLQCRLVSPISVLSINNFFILFKVSRMRRSKMRRQQV